MSTVVQLANSLITVLNAHTVKYLNKEHFGNNVNSAVVLGKEVVLFSEVQNVLKLLYRVTNYLGP